MKTILPLFFLFAQLAFAEPCKLEISGTDAMQFDKKELKVKASCTEVELTLKHSGKLPKAAMGHNWILVKTEDFAAMSTKEMQAGAAKEYAPEGTFAATKLVGGGETTTVKFKMKDLKKGGDYTYFCGFPGHSALMKGKLIVE